MRMRWWRKGRRARMMFRDDVGMVEMWLDYIVESG
jgi:hypothetical protein